MNEESLEKLVRSHYRHEKQGLERHATGPDCCGYATLRRAARGEPVAPVVDNHLETCPRCQQIRDLFRPDELRAAGRGLRVRSGLIPHPSSLIPLKSRPAWLAIPALLLLALGAVFFIPRESHEQQAYGVLLAASQQPDLQVARADVSSRLADLLPGVESTTRGLAERGGADGDQPNGISFLPHDSIPLRAVNRLHLPPPYLFTIEDIGARPSAISHQPQPTTRNPQLTTQFAAVPPSGGWAPGRHRWICVNGNEDRVGEGQFQVLTPAAQRLVERAERELARDPLRLAAVYYVLGLAPRANAAVTRALRTIPPAEREGVRERFGLSAPGPGLP